MKHAGSFRGQSDIVLPNVEVASRRTVEQCKRWESALSAQAKDRRYYELVEDTIDDEFDYRYFIVRDHAGEICSIQPFFLLEQDLLIGTKRKFGWLTNVVRRLWPRFMVARTMMVGCAAGEGHLDGKDETSERSSARLLASAIVHEARKLKARLIVLKEFPAKYRQTLECFVDKGFTRIPSMPNVMLNIDYPSFEEYMMRALSSGARRKLRLKLRATEQASPIEMSVVDDISPVIDDVYPLYLEVYHRSDLHFEKLTKEYFCGLGIRLGEKNRFFVWRQNGKIIAFGCCLLQGDMIHAEYLGLDYTVALDLHLYHYTFRDLIGWGITNGYKWFHSSALNYDPKFHLRYRLDPIDLYVRHTSPVFNLILRHILPWIEPTRYDKTLPMFDNYHELWAPAVGNQNSWIATARNLFSRSKDTVAATLQTSRAWISSVVHSVSEALETGWAKLAASAGVVAASTLALLEIDRYYSVPYLVFGYILPVLLIGIRFGRTTTLSTAMLSCLCAGFFFVEPQAVLDAVGGNELTIWLSFCAIALFASQLPIKKILRGFPPSDLLRVRLDQSKQLPK